MKHILIPTDFSEKSLELIRFTANVFADEEIKITLLHVLRMPDSINDLLLLPRHGRHYRLVNPDFRKGYESLQQVYRQTIKHLYVEFLHGDTLQLFRNFLFARHIDAIVYPDNYIYLKPGRDSVDPKDLIRKAGCPVLTNVWEQGIKVLQTAEL
jgi:hypothetical protein